MESVRGTTVLTDVAGDHASKSQESTGGDFGAPHCSLLRDPIKWLFGPPSGLEHEGLDRIPVAICYPIVSWRAASPHPAFGTPLPRAGEML